MADKFNTIDDFDVENKTVLVRIDINSPVDPSSGIILDDTRLKLHAKTIKELSNKGAKVVLLAHQSRPGKKDFTDLSQHANALSDLLNLRVKYIDSIFSKAAKEAIKQLKPHEILLLENVRFFSEESTFADNSTAQRMRMQRNCCRILRDIRNPSDREDVTNET